MYSFGKAKTSAACCFLSVKHILTHTPSKTKAYQQGKAALLIKFGGKIDTLLS